VGKRVEQRLRNNYSWVWDFFWGDENVLALVIKNAQLCEYTNII
jgi:hypothetical protein